MSTEQGSPPRTVTRAAARNTTRVTVGAVAILLAALTNATFVLAGLTSARLGTVNSFVSELGARGEPAAMFFRMSDLTTGLLLAAGLLLAWPGIPRTRRSGHLAPILLLVFCAATMLDSLLPLDCVPTVDAACRAAEKANQVSLGHELHGITGVTESTAIGLALLIFGVGLWTEPGWRFLSRTGLVLGVIYMIGNLAIVVQYLYDQPGLGITQRIQIVTFSTFLILLAVEIIARSRPRHGPG